jgi:biopolymer transport protein ExbD
MAMRSPKPAGTGVGLPLSVWIGIVLILLGLATYGSIQYWMMTRTFVPVDMPVSLATGHIKTGPFPINLRDVYSIWIDLDENAQSDATCNAYSSLRTRWVLYRSGQAAEKWDYPVLLGTYLEGFYAQKGTYEVDVEVISDASCLNPAHPRLRVTAGKGEYQEEFSPLMWLSVLCIGAGIGLLALFGISQRSREGAQAASLNGSQSVVQYFQWAQKLPLKAALSGLPSFGLVCSLLLSWLVMFHMAFHQVGRFHSKGIGTSVMQHVPLAQNSGRWTEPLVLSVRASGPGLLPTLYLNSKLLSWEELDSALKVELSTRSVWIVYVEADSNVSWQDALRAIDAARGLQAKVVLLTSRPESKQH